ncbi:hypothetical protein CRYUN_Cryun05aG0108100 [Craigia yunnanensis]
MYFWFSLLFLGLFLSLEWFVFALFYPCFIRYDAAVQGINATRSYYQGQALDSLENSANKENKAQHQEQDMEIGYEGSPSSLTFEGLEGKFLDEIKKLVKEQSEAEDTEIVRHKEKIIEINIRYQEKLSALRAQQANRREEFLREESKTRLHQYQQAGISSHSNSGLQDACGYGGTAVAAAAGETRGYNTGPFESYRDRSHFTGGGRTQRPEAMVPYPKGRVYNSSSEYY